MKNKVMVVFGTRPEAIKMVPVVKACKARPELEVKVCVTAQHRQMLDQVMDIFGLAADFDLNVMAPNQTLGNVTCKVLRNGGCLRAVAARRDPRPGRYDDRFVCRAEIIWEKGTNRAEFFRSEINKYGWGDTGSSFLPSEVGAAFLWA